MKEKLTTLLLLTTLTIPNIANAVLLIDKNYSKKRVEQNQCIKERKDNEFNIYQHKHKNSYGVQSNFTNEKNFIKLLSDLYGCNLQSDEAYILSMNNRKKDGSIRTLMYSTTLNPLDEINMTNLKLHKSIEEVLENPEFSEYIEKYGEKNIFFQKINLKEFAFEGIYNIEGIKLKE